MAESLEYRVVVLGPGSVGKSALVIRFIQGNWVSKYDPTVEDSYRKQVDYDGKQCLMVLMDTAGQEEYRALREQFMMTIVSRKSFEDVKRFHSRIMFVKENVHDLPIILVGNKMDLRAEAKADKEVSFAEGQERATDLGIAFIEASAKENFNVTELFMRLLRLMDEARLRSDPKDKEGSGRTRRKRCELL